MCGTAEDMRHARPGTRGYLSRALSTVGVISLRVTISIAAGVSAHVEGVVKQ